ncbi:Signal recognition particle, subunit Ffh SRP54 [Clostridiaceae bacterium JG1575]|nr:Signal recognition particle, subunit Ffh SRP54 [Clostridiaceae bacterium JG1575]
MAFDSLGDRLQESLKKLRGKGSINEADIRDAMREVKLALLEADVNFKVVKQFVRSVSAKAIDESVMKSLTPGQMVVKIVHEELTHLMGDEEMPLQLRDSGMTVYMLCGLQGAGKTTMAGKLALYMRKNKNRKPMLIACDVYRPAAIKQLEVVGKQIDVPVFSLGDQVSPVEIAQRGIEFARENGSNFVLIDTAGRLHIDEALMQELQQIKEAVSPKETLLVVDAMTGQDAVNVAQSFDEQLSLSGVILTKLDGDTRGGAALSIREMTGKPIKMVGIGEKMNDLEPFFPERMASRILGMGDVLSLIEKAQAELDEDEAQKLTEKMLSKEFNFEDYLGLMAQMKRLGPLTKIMEMIPGMNKAQMQGINVEEGEKSMKMNEAIIQSMTPRERKNPKLIDSSRKKRIAKGAGVTTADVNRLMKGLEESKKLMKRFGGKLPQGKGGGLFGGNLPI